MSNPTCSHLYVLYRTIAHIEASSLVSGTIVATGSSSFLSTFRFFQEGSNYLRSKMVDNSPSNASNFLFLGFPILFPVSHCQNQNPQRPALWGSQNGPTGWWRSPLCALSGPGRAVWEIVMLNRLVRQFQPITYVRAEYRKGLKIDSLEVVPG
jgi:hypothetical protein